MKYFIGLKSLGVILIIFLLSSCVEYHDQPKYYPSADKGTMKVILDLEGSWRFSLGDDLEWKEKNFNDASWEKVDVPSRWENQGFPGYDGYAWYRKSFNLKSDINKNLYLVLGYVDDVDQTFLNGNLIGISGGFPPHYTTAYNALRVYYLPKEYLNLNGENVIAVRVYDDELDGGIVSGQIGIYENAKGLEPDINLSGIWDFKTGNNPEWSKKNVVYSNWSKLIVPAHWEIQGYPDYDGFAWYRKSFYLPKEFSRENMILLLGKIDDIDQTFVNGIFVGSTGLWNFKEKPTSFNKNGEWQRNRVYTIPEKLLNFGGYNTIAVRVYDGIGDGGIYDGPIGLITQSNYRKNFGSK